MQTASGTLSESRFKVMNGSKFPGQVTSAEPLPDYHELLMRGQSPLTVAERELIAAYVSALNECAYCRGVHEIAAGEFGIPIGTLDALVSNIDSAPIEDRLKPIFRYVRRLTLEPELVADADSTAIFAEEWNDEALYSLVSICALFNFMNRLVEGLGIQADETYQREAGRRLHVSGYAAIKSLLPLRSAR